MQKTFSGIGAFLSHGFDAVIDVRSPSEFAEDHVPGAINLPVLDDAERARVGTIYKKESPFLARKIGAALVFRNASNHIEGPLAGHDGAWRPLVYCWRGGQRSGSFAWMLREIGWRAETVQGGYKSYRRLVVDLMHGKSLPHRLVLLGGNTGTAKTALLQHLERRGIQVLDLEDLARHRGSLLGARPGGQPSQKAFETALAVAVQALDPARPVVVEAESSKIGTLLLPPALWSAMKSAPWIEVSASSEMRVRYLDRAYDDILSDTEALRAKLAPLRFHRGAALVDEWMAMIGQGRRRDLVASLMADHYDPAYRKARSVIAPRILHALDLPGLDDADLERAADDLAAALQTMDI
ncbi:tRNA 2-selenouridine(34) synthase MnmH [Thalassococcus sp. CAU 1522]|uniref:tRNA 2-selenouridine(34) synthase MnmH n=1 Tax=Thalassococcus arenae TaxID=2851652 RepID=A0ABS6N3M1_9RHOB|nr:tRNA 2-selenouridine(34) synthase MnmH [Thalassococcus arenae]MBV2358617.1 tRNA 2-selenouridine(34) synthase MnmH [Thalassococcus arenae]